MRAAVPGKQELARILVLGAVRTGKTSLIRRLFEFAAKKHGISSPSAPSSSGTGTLQLVIHVRAKSMSGYPQFEPTGTPPPPIGGAAAAQQQLREQEIRTITLEVSPSDTIKDVKTRLQLKFGWPVRLQTLIKRDNAQLSPLLRNEELPDEVTRHGKTRLTTLRYCKITAMALAATHVDKAGKVRPQIKVFLELKAGINLRTSPTSTSHGRTLQISEPQMMDSNYATIIHSNYAYVANHLILILYNMSSSDSVGTIRNQIQDYQRNAKEAADPRITKQTIAKQITRKPHIVLVGTKLDKVGKRPSAEDKAVTAYARQHGYLHARTCLLPSRTDANVDRLYSIIEHLLQCSHPLHDAIKQRDHRMVSLLVEVGADANTLQRGVSPLELALNDQEMALQLLPQTDRRIIEKCDVKKLRALKRYMIRRDCVSPPALATSAAPAPSYPDPTRTVSLRWQPCPLAPPAHALFPAFCVPLLLSRSKSAAPSLLTLWSSPWTNGSRALPAQVYLSKRSGHGISHQYWRGRVRAVTNALHVGR